MSFQRKKVEYLVVDTSAFIRNAPLHEITEHSITCKEVVDEITNKRQLRRLVALPFDLEIKEVDPENIKIIRDFAIKTGDYPSLSATDIKVMALTYQLEKEKVGTEHLRTKPIIQSSSNKVTTEAPHCIDPNFAGFFFPKKTTKQNFDSEKETDDSEHTEMSENLNTSASLDVVEDEVSSVSLDVIEKTKTPDSEDLNGSVDEVTENEDSEDSDGENDDSGWITPSNLQKVKKQVDSAFIEEKHVTVACMTTDFAMQNVLKQMNLNVSALDGRMIKQLRTFILRCYACFKTTSLMTKSFCPNCGNETLKKVAVSLDDNGKMQIHINTRRPLTGRGKKFSLPTIRGGKHPNNPILVPDQPMAHNELSKKAKAKTDALHEDYIAGYSPFVMKDLNSRSAKLRVGLGSQMKHWMKKNPNEAHKKRK